MLELFRREQPFNYILLFFYCLLLRLAPFFSETNWTPPANGPLSEIVYGWTGFTSIAAVLTGTFLIYIQAIMVNVMVNSNRLTRENSFFAAIFYVLLMTLFPDFNYLSPAMMANTFLIIALFNILNAYKKTGHSIEVFNGGFFIGMAMLCHVSFGIFFFAGFIGFLMMRAFRPVEQIQYLIGFGIPVFLCGTYYFWNNQLPDFVAIFQSNFKWLDWVANMDQIFYIKLAIFIILLLFSLFNYPNFGKKSNVHSANKVNVLVWFIAISILSFGFQTGIRLDQLLIMVVPLSILLGFSILIIPNKQIAEVFHFLLIAVSFLFQYILL